MVCALEGPGSKEQKYCIFRGKTYRDKTFSRTLESKTLRGRGETLDQRDSRQTNYEDRVKEHT